MQVKTVEASTQEWIRKSIMAYLEGEQNLKWIVGIVGSGAANAREMLLRLKNYRDRQRYQGLADCLTLQP